MNERRIISMNEERPTEIERAFLTKEQLTQEDIRAYAKAVAQRLTRGDLDDKKKPLLILKSFEHQTLLKLIRAHLQPDEELPSLSEFTPELNRLRAGIIDALQQELPLHETHFLRLALNAHKAKQRTVRDPKLQGRGKAKKPNPYIDVLLTQDATKKEHIVRDATRLKETDTRDLLAVSIPTLMRALETEPNPHFMSIESFDPQTGSMVVEQKDMATLYEYLEDFNADEAVFAGQRKHGHITKEQMQEHDQTKRMRTKEILPLLRDALDAAEYLTRHGLVLQDLKTANVGIVNDEKLQRTSAVFFDYDGLTLSGTPLQSRISTEQYHPPEANGEDAVERIDPIEMNFQVGRIIQDVLANPGFTFTEEEQQLLKTLAERLTFFLPGQSESRYKRLSLAEAKKSLETLFMLEKKNTQN